MVETENKLSDFGKISYGVPQGSILGPLLFLIYVNDIPQAVKSNLLLYADDSVLCTNIKTLQSVYKVYLHWKKFTYITKFTYIERNQPYIDAYTKFVILDNALIQPHFDYGSSSWFPLLKKNLKLKLQKAPNKSIHLWLNLRPRSHTDPLHFRKINWLPVSHRVEYCIANTVFNYWTGIGPG